MDLSGKQVLVTGAGGFIASHLVERLVSAGTRVRAFTRYNSRNDVGMLRLVAPDIFSQLEIIHGDLRDVEAGHEAMNNVYTSFHLGGLVAITYSYGHPRERFETNIILTINHLISRGDQKVF